MIGSSDDSCGPEGGAHKAKQGASYVNACPLLQSAGTSTACSDAAAGTHSAQACFQPSVQLGQRTARTHAWPRHYPSEG